MRQDTHSEMPPAINPEIPQERKKAKLDIPEDGFPKVIIGEGLQDEVILQTVMKIGGKKEFINEVIKAFKEIKSIKEDSVVVEKYKGGLGINREAHYIINCEKEEGGNKETWHAKPALHGPGNSGDSQFKELAIYKILESLKTGPECDGFVSEDEILMILTKDLSSGSLDKQTFFNNNLDSHNKHNLIPTRARENTLRIAIETVIEMLSLVDVQKNLGNTGFKRTIRVTEDFDIIEKFKPYILDFRLLNTEDMKGPEGIAFSLNLTDYKIENIQKYTKNLQEILVGDNEISNIEFKKNIFNFEHNKSHVEEALAKLFLDEAGEINKFSKAVENGFAFAMKKLTESCGISDENFATFLEALKEQKKAGILNPEENFKQLLEALNEQKNEFASNPEENSKKFSKALEDQQEKGVLNPEENFKQLFKVLGEVKNVNKLNLEENSKKSPEEIKELKEQNELNVKKNFVKHFTALNELETEKLEMLKIFLKNDVIKTFLEEAGKKVKEEKISQLETDSNPRTGVSPTSSSGKSIGSEDEHSKSP